MLKYKQYLIFTFLAVLIIIMFNMPLNAMAQVQYFDESGRIIFETEGKEATSVGYSTVGWLIKRYELAASDPRNMTIVYRFSNEAYTDSDGIVHSTFYADKDEILKAIKDVDGDWAEMLTNAGGIIHIDAIMTCTYYGEELGFIDDAGGFHGELYTTFEGISNARGWGNPEELREYYGKKVWVEPVKESVVVPETIVESSMYAVNLAEYMPSIRLDGGVYDVRQGIPSGEILDINLKTNRIKGEIIRQKNKVKQYYPVRFKVNASRLDYASDGSRILTDCSFEHWEIVSRECEYELIKNYKLEVLSEVDVSIGDLKKEVNIKDNIFEISRQGGYEKALVKDVEIDVGLIEKISDINVDYAMLAQNAVRSMNSKDDAIVLSAEKENIFNIKTKLDEGMRNGEYEVIVNAKYNIYSSDNEDVVTASETFDREKIVVHTPIYLEADIINNEEKRLAIGKAFTLSGSFKGQHLAIPGFGLRDYSKFCKGVKVSFDFDVVVNEVVIKAGNLVKIDGNIKFKIPENVNPGNYRITLYAEAINAGNSYGMQERANTSIANHGVYAYCDVEVYDDGEWRKEFMVVGTH